MLNFTWQVLSLEFEDDEDLLLLDETVSKHYVLRVVCTCDVFFHFPDPVAGFKSYKLLCVCLLS